MDNTVDISIVCILLILVTLSIMACVVVIVAPVLASWLFSLLIGAIKALWLLF